MNKNKFKILFLAMLIAFNSAAFAAKKESPSPSPSSSPSVAASDKKTTNDKKATDEKNSDDKKTEDDKKTIKDTKIEDDKTTSTKNEEKTTFPVPNAKSAIVIDSNSGDVIYALDADKKVFPAGTSNIMTAIVALENSNLNDYCNVTEEALANVKYDQPQFGMKVGESYSVEELLYAIILNSNNDAANVLAIKVSGSIDAFVRAMNEKAASLGMSGTHFANPTGLQDENHYTTAADMATLAQYAMKNQTYATIAKTQKYVFPATSMRSSEKTILSTNHLISRYKYPYHYYANATGIKSGNSTDAGYCLVASAVKGSTSLISVVMGCPNEDVKDKAYSFTNTAAMFDYVFENYQTVLLAKKGDVVYDSKVSEAKNSTRLALTVEEDVYTTMKKTADAEIITNEVELTAEAKAPISQGDLFGTVTYSYNGRELKKVNLVAANDVKRDFMLHVINSILGFIFNPIVIILLILIIAVWVRMRIIRNRKRRIRHSRMVSRGNTNNSGTRSRSRYENRGGSYSSQRNRGDYDFTRRRR